MKEKIFKKIFLGKYLTWEPKRIYSKEEIKLFERVENEKQYFLSKMDDVDKKRFEIYQNLMAEIDYEDWCYTSYENFMIGISVGIEIKEFEQSQEMSMG